MTTTTRNHRFSLTEDEIDVLVTALQAEAARRLGGLQDMELTGTAWRRDWEAYTLASALQARAWRLQKRARNQAPETIFTKADVGCYFDSARGVYIGEAVQASAALHGWAPADGVVACDHDDCETAHDEADHGTHYHEATIQAEDHLNGLTTDDVWFGPTESGDWGLWPLEEEDN